MLSRYLRNLKLVLQVGNTLGVTDLSPFAPYGERPEGQESPHLPCLTWYKPNNHVQWCKSPSYWSFQHRYKKTLAHTHTTTRPHAHTGWPSSLREGGYPSLHCCLPVSSRRLPWKQGLTGNNRRERKKSGALPTSPPLLLCVPRSKYPFPTRCISK